jgi:disease resistance protein RPM1
MEAALVSASTGALNSVLEKLAALMGDEYKRLKDVRHMFLTEELAAMHESLLNMSEEEEPDAQDKVWMMAVRELSYDMEDSIDDFMQSVDDKDAKLDGFIENIKHSMENLGKMKTHRRIGKEIQDLKKQIGEVGDMNKSYKVGNMSGSNKSGVAISSINNATVDPRAFTIFEHASKLIGIDESKVDLVKMLNEDSICVSKPEQPKIVSIVGPRGMEKTTLAKHVYQELKWQFHCQAFVCVSRNPNMMDIMSTLFTDVSKQYYDELCKTKYYADTEAGSIQHLIGKINNYLVDKRYYFNMDTHTNTS